MPKHVIVPAPAPVPATLAEQKSDFTAEGSPPPGKVSSTTPLTPAALEKAAVSPKSAPKPAPKLPPKPAPKPHPPSHKRAG